MAAPGHQAARNLILGEGPGLGKRLLSAFWTTGQVSKINVFCATTSGFLYLMFLEAVLACYGPIDTLVLSFLVHVLSLVEIYK